MYRFVQRSSHKFVIFRSLISKRAEEIAYKMWTYSRYLGHHLYFDGREFLINVTNLKELLKIHHGKLHHSQSHVIVERANQGIENMFRTWMQDPKSGRWSEGFVMFNL